jgi:hypothetical protein
MKATIAVLLMATFAVGFAPRAHAQTAGEMASYCAPYRHGLVLQAKPGGHSLVEAPGANANSYFCWGEFAALQQFASLQAVGAVALFPSAHPAARFCIPPDTERLQLVKGFLQYMDRHSESRNLDFGAVLLTIMQQAYPCPGR